MESEGGKGEGGSEQRQGRVITFYYVVVRSKIKVIQASFTHFQSSLGADVCRPRSLAALDDACSAQRRPHRPHTLSATLSDAPAHEEGYGIAL